MRDSLNLSTEFLLDPVKVETIVVCNKIDGQPKMSESATTANAVKVCLGVFREVEVYDDVDCLDIDTTRQQIRTHEVTADAVSEVVEHAVSMSL